MSRIGRQTIKVPEKVSVKLDSGVVKVTGPKGELNRSWPKEIIINESTTTTDPSGKQIQTAIKNAARAPELSPLWGTYTAHLKNMVRGVTEGFEKKLIIEGVGYKAAIAGDKLTLNLGYSHPVIMPIPPSLKLAVEKNVLTVSGIDREVVGQFAAKVRANRTPNAYKDKGIRYDDEVVIKKQSSKVATTG